MIDDPLIYASIAGFCFFFMCLLAKIRMPNENNTCSKIGSVHSLKIQKLECVPNHIVPDFHGNLLTPTSPNLQIGSDFQQVASTTPDCKSSLSLSLFKVCFPVADTLSRAWDHNDDSLWPHLTRTLQGNQI